jgi:hypothetical protein
MQGRRSPAISLLRESLDNGYRGPPFWPPGQTSILDAPEFASLHGDPEFEAIVEELEERVTAEHGSGTE